VEKIGGDRLRPYIRQAAAGLGAADKPLPFAVFEEFDLAQALFRFRFAFVGTAKALALLGKYFVAFFHFLDHSRTSDSILMGGAVSAMHRLL
jgi:hypothetical protein